MTEELPNLAQIVGRLLQRLPLEQQPLLIALAERMAAERYRRWADEVVVEEKRALLLACAAREEEIARRLESLRPDAEVLQQAALAGSPDLAEANRQIFAGRPLMEQFAIQAQGERLGAAPWRAFARRSVDEHHRDVFTACAGLEEDSAIVLESFVRGGAESD